MAGGPGEEREGCHSPEKKNFGARKSGPQNRPTTSRVPGSNLTSEPVPSSAKGRLPRPRRTIKFGRLVSEPLCERTLKQKLFPKSGQAHPRRSGQAPESAGAGRRVEGPRPSACPGRLHLLLLAFEQQKRLEGRRGVHLGAAAASGASAAPPPPPEHFSASSSGCAAASESPAAPSPREAWPIAPYRAGGSCAGTRIRGRLVTLRMRESGRSLRFVACSESWEVLCVLRYPRPG